MSAPAKPAQLILAFDAPPRYEAEEFLVCASNRAAHEMVAAWPAWPDAAAILAGPPGGGKSHLAAIWARRAAAVALDPATVRAEAGLGALYERNLLLEDADRLGDERGLFHLFNLVQEGGASLLMTAQNPPDLWGLTLPDLRSRLRRAPLATIEAPDESLVHAVLVKLFADRQLIVDAPVIDYIALRVGRSLDEARELVAEIDRKSLALGKKVTRAIAAQALAEAAPENGEPEGD